MTRKPKLKPVRCWMVVDSDGSEKCIRIHRSNAYDMKLFFGGALIPGRFVPDKPKKRKVRK